MEIPRVLLGAALAVLQGGVVVAGVRELGKLKRRQDDLEAGQATQALLSRVRFDRSLIHANTLFTAAVAGMAADGRREPAAPKLQEPAPAPSTPAAAPGPAAGYRLKLQGPRGGIGTGLTDDEALAYRWAEGVAERMAPGSRLWVIDPDGFEDELFG